MSKTIDGKEQLKIFTTILVSLKLTYYDGAVDQTNFLINLLKDYNLSEDLTKKFAEVGFKAFKESNGDTDKYLPLCAKYINADM
jgi:hypothetical protein